MSCIRFNSSVSGANFVYQPGDVVEWPHEDEVQRFEERGIAERLSPEAAEKAAASSGRSVRRHRPVEKATRSAPETAATR
jgi:hypothetical protein